MKIKYDSIVDFEIFKKGKYRVYSLINAFFENATVVAFLGTAQLSLESGEKAGTFFFLNIGR